MKSFVCIALVAFAAAALASPTNVASATGSTGSSVTTQDGELEGVTGQGFGDLTRLRKSAYGGSSGGYGGSSIPAPPCPKNYLFSCQPNLAPVPCSAPAPSYGSAGAYSSPGPPKLFSTITSCTICCCLLLRFRYASEGSTADDLDGRLLKHPVLPPQVEASKPAC